MSPYRLLLVEQPSIIRRKLFFTKVMLLCRRFRRKALIAHFGTFNERKVRCQYCMKFAWASEKGFRPAHTDTFNWYLINNKICRDCNYEMNRRGVSRNGATENKDPLFFKKYYIDLPHPCKPEIVSE